MYTYVCMYTYVYSCMCVYESNYTHICFIFSEHSCSYPGCGTVLVLDGNMKNHRDVCYAKDAGFIEFEGLKGLIKTGCAATPKYKSQYCDKHKNQACNLLYVDQIDTEEDLGIQTGPELRDRSSVAQSKKAGNAIAELILSKKATRKQMYYQVCTYVVTILVPYLKQVDSF